MLWFGRHADFEIVGLTDDIVFVVDLDLGGPSLTNDAAYVVRRVCEAFPGKRVIYRDSMGRWDEMSHRDGVFTGFRPYATAGTTPIIVMRKSE